MIANSLMFQANAVRALTALPQQTVQLPWQLSRVQDAVSIFGMDVRESRIFGLMNRKGAAIYGDVSALHQALQQGNVTLDPAITSSYQKLSPEIISRRTARFPSRYDLMNAYAQSIATALEAGLAQTLGEPAAPADQTLHTGLDTAVARTESNATLPMSQLPELQGRAQLVNQARIIETAPEAFKRSDALTAFIKGISRIPAQNRAPVVRRLSEYFWDTEFSIWHKVASLLKQGAEACSLKPAEFNAVIWGIAESMVNERLINFVQFRFPEELRKLVTKFLNQQQKEQLAMASLGILQGNPDTEARYAILKLVNDLVRTKQLSSGLMAAIREQLFTITEVAKSMDRAALPASMIACLMQHSDDDDKVRAMEQLAQLASYPISGVVNQRGVIFVRALTDLPPRMQKRCLVNLSAMLRDEARKEHRQEIGRFARDILEQRVEGKIEEFTEWLEIARQLYHAATLENRRTVARHYVGVHLGEKDEAVRQRAVLIFDEIIRPDLELFPVAEQ